MASVRIPPEEANAKALSGERIVYVDSRKAEDWDASDRKIPNAVRVPPDDVQTHLNELAKNETIILYCT